MSKTVELNHAFSWTCDDCGLDNFARAVTVPHEAVNPDFVSEQDQAAFEAFGQGDWYTRPDRVTCDHCRATFQVETED